jgi:hypothetical protein
MLRSCWLAARPCQNAMRTRPCVEAWAVVWSHPVRFLASLAFHRCYGRPLRDRCDWRKATYARTGTGVASIISELPGERAEALFIAMAALVPTAGEQSEISI